jgi:hypothetical protein
MLLCDEPTASLDVKSVGVVMQQLQRFSQVRESGYSSNARSALSALCYAGCRSAKWSGLGSLAIRIFKEFDKRNESMKSSITALVLLLILTCCNNKQDKTVTPVQPKVTEPVRIIAIGRVEPEVKITEIGSEVNGVIRKIYTHAGDTVKERRIVS